MRRGRKAGAIILTAACAISVLLLSACKKPEGNSASLNAYYVISEELDSKRTADKVTE